MARLVRSGADARRRQEYTAGIRCLCGLGIAAEPQCPWPAELVRLEAGEPVRVQGWQVGRATDFSSYWLEPDGYLTPLPAVGSQRGRVG